MPKPSRLSAVSNLNQFLKLSPSILASSARIHSIESPALASRGSELSLLRLDELDSKLGGNKCFKLYAHAKAYAQAQAQAQLHAQQNLPIASFGGAHSNHLYALAAFGEKTGIPTLGVIRGEATEACTDTMNDLVAMGMRIQRVSRSDYRRRYDAQWLLELEATLGSVFWIPEGGSGLNGVQGAMAIGQAIAKQHQSQAISHVALACGTAATLAGVILGLADTNVKVIGFSALKGALEGLNHCVTETLSAQTFVKSHQLPNWRINGDFHCGGFGRYPDKLAQFVDEFEPRTRVLLDPVYTAKLMYGIEQIAQEDGWPENSQILAIHTGGLQGRRGVKRLKYNQQRFIGNNSGCS